MVTLWAAYSNNKLSEEISPITQPKPPLAQLDAISPFLSLGVWEKSPILTSLQPL